MRCRCLLCVCWQKLGIFTVVCLVTQPILNSDGIRMAFDHSTGHNCLAFITHVLNQRLFLYMLVSSNNFRLMALDLHALLLAFAIASYKRAPNFHSGGCCLPRWEPLKGRSVAMTGHVHWTEHFLASILGLVLVMGVKDVFVSLSFYWVFFINSTCVPVSFLILVLISALLSKWHTM